MAIHDARAVANQIIIQAKKRGRALTPMQVLKLVYISHGWMLGLYGRPLFHQPVEAWQYGPVVADVYHTLKGYGSSPVQNPIHCQPEFFDSYESSIIDQVVQMYENWDGIALSNWTHKDGSPWHTTWNFNGRNSPIPTDLIQGYFNRLAHDSNR
jgi:uncharacterized phage-associated protein